jgi:hypothetical protein
VKIPVFGDLHFIEHLETVALEHLRSSAVLEDDHLPEDSLLAVLMQVLQIGVHDPPGLCDTAGVGEQIYMEVGSATGRLRNFLPSLCEDPLHELLRGCVVAGIAEHPANEERHVVVRIVQLLPQGKTGAEQVSTDFSVHEQDEGGLVFPIGVVRGEIIREDLAILEHRIDRISEKPCFATQLPYTGAVSRLKFANLELLVGNHGNNWGRV